MRLPLTPFGGKAEFQRRRRELMGMMGEGAVAVLPAAHPARRNGDVEYRFRQHSDFAYLTGLFEPNAIMVLIPGRPAGETVLFCRERDPQRERWDGEMMGTERAVDELGFDDAFPIDDVDDILPGLLEGRARIFYTLGRDTGLDKQLIDWVEHLRNQAACRGQVAPGEIISLEACIHEMRLLKTPPEMQLMRRSAEITVDGHKHAMRTLSPGIGEYELEAALWASFRSRDAVMAYPPIVGGGANACVLHYIDNRARLRNGDLVLIDAGAEYLGYASDVTRTLPVSGRYSPEQRAVYDIVLAAQEAAIDCVAPGRHWLDGHAAAVRCITQGLVDLGVLQGSVDGLIEQRAHSPFFMHKTGHWLGLDVHDVGDYRIDGQWRELEPGMVLTVEPGLYFSPDDARVPEALRGIAIRIEDDIAVTRAGHDNLTAALPKSAAAIEEMVQQRAAA